MDDHAHAHAHVTTGDGSITLVSPRYGETFRSRHGAHAEARHVFVEGSGIGARLRAGRASVVLEVGLGGATNFVATAAVALSTGTPLHHHAFDTDLPSAAAWASLAHETLAPADFVAALLRTRHGWGTIHDRPQGFHHGCVTLTWYPASIDMRTERAAPLTGAVDAVYQDAFSPAANPDAWSTAVLTDLATCLRPGGTLVSYSVAGRVRRDLATAGLRVERRPGPPGGKREMLLAWREP